MSCTGGGDDPTATPASETGEGCCEFLTDTLRAFTWIASEQKCFMKTGDGMTPPDWGKHPLVGDMCGYLPPAGEPTPPPTPPIPPPRTPPPPTPPPPPPLLLLLLLMMIMMILA